MERACEKQDSVCNLVAVFENNRTPGEAPGSHSLEDQPHSPEHQLSLSPEPWEAPPVKEALKSEFRPVSRTYLSSLKNKLSSGAWRRSCQPGVSPGPETQEPEEKRVVRELLETEQAYVARLHLLDQASGDPSKPIISQVPMPAQDLALTQPTDIVGWLWESIRTEPFSTSCIVFGPGQPHTWQPRLIVLTRCPLLQPRNTQGLGRHIWGCSLFPWPSPRESWLVSHL